MFGTDIEALVMSETSKHFRCLFSTEVRFKDKYIRRYLAGSTQLDSFIDFFIR